MRKQFGVNGTSIWHLGIATCLFLVLDVIGLTVPNCGFAQEDKVLATVNDAKITLGGVQHHLRSAIGQQDLTGERKVQLEKVTLNRLTEQLIVLEFLRDRKLAADPSEIGVQLDLIKAELSKVDETLDARLEKTGQSLDELKNQIDWQLSWKNYLGKKLTDEFLEGYYARHKRRFDGTELRVAHILLKTASNASTTAVDELTTKAHKIKAELKEDKLDWGKACEENSDAPTSKTEGMLGWIRLTGPMPKSFSEAAFKLNVGEISGPVQTRFGVHLIKCVEIKQGKIGWLDAQDELRRAATRALFEAIVKQHRPNVEVKVLMN